MYGTFKPTRVLLARLLLIGVLTLTTMAARIAAARHLTAAALPSGAAQRIIAVQPHPRAVALDGRTGHVFVTSRGIVGFPGSVSVLAAGDGTVLRTVPVGLSPGVVAVDERTGRAFVANGGDVSNGHAASVSVLDTASGAVLRATPLIHGSYPSAIAVDAVAGRVFVADLAGGRGAVTVLDARSGALLRTLVLDARSGALLRTLVLGGSVQPVALDARGGRAIVVTSDDRAHLLDARSGRVLHSVAVGHGASAVALDSRTGHAFVANQDDNTVSMLDAASGAVLRVTDVGVAPGAVAIDERDGRVLVANQGDDTVTVLDGASGLLLHSIATSLRPVAIAVDEQSGRALVVGNFDVSVLDVRGGRVAPLAEMGAGVVAMALDGRRERAFVVGGDGTVRVLAVGPALTIGGRAWPPTLTTAHSRVVIQAFVDAYNRHDVAGVIALFPARFLYGDCDYARHTSSTLTSKAALAAWLRARFAEHDYFAQANVVMNGPQSYPVNDPRGGGVENLRTSDALRAQHGNANIAFKITLTPDGTRIQRAALASSPASCAANE
jgi:YVTN family beta-propeller protein